MTALQRLKLLLSQLPLKGEQQELGVGDGMHGLRTQIVCHVLSMCCAQLILELCCGVLIGAAFVVCIPAQGCAVVYLFVLPLSLCVAGTLLTSIAAAAQRKRRSAQSS